MYPPLPLCEPADKLAALFNEYAAGLAPAADALAPRLSLRQLNTVSSSDAYQEAACLFYRLHALAAALPRLHGAYLEATAILTDFADTYTGNLEAYELGRGNLRSALAPIFANLTTTTEAIGAANPNQIYSISEWNAQAKSVSKRLGLPGVPRPRFGGKHQKDTAHVVVAAVLKEGQHLAAEFLSLMDSVGYLQLLSRLIRVQQLKGYGWST